MAFHPLFEVHYSCRAAIATSAADEICFLLFEKRGHTLLHISFHRHIGYKTNGCYFLDERGSVKDYPATTAGLYANWERSELRT
jgi:hypothetical protein